MGLVAVLLTLAIAMAVWFYYPVSSDGTQSATSIGENAVERALDIKSYSGEHNAQIEAEL